MAAPIAMARRAFAPWAAALAQALALAVAFALAGPARADIWGYVDEKGVAHFASERLTDRYELFYRSAETFDTLKDPPPPEPARMPQGVALSLVPEPEQREAVPTRLLNFFEVSPTFKAVRPILHEVSQDHAIDFELLQALIVAESGFNAQAVSPKGALGLMQIMPDTARRYGIDGDRKASIERKLFDPRTNIRTGTRYLRDLINMFPGQLELAVAAYNAGEGAVMRAGNRIPNFKETQAYVKTVMQLYRLLKPPPPPPPPVAAPAPAETLHPLSRVRPSAPLVRGGAINRGNLPPSAPQLPLPGLPKTDSSP